MSERKTPSTSDAGQKSRELPPRSFRRSAIYVVLVAVGVVFLLSILSSVFVACTQAFLVLFAGVLLGISVARIGKHLTRLTGIPQAVSAVSVVVVFLLLMLGFLWLFGASIQSQVIRATRNFDEALVRVEKMVESTPFLVEMQKVWTNSVQPKPSGEPGANTGSRPANSGESEQATDAADSGLASIARQIPVTPSAVLSFSRSFITGTFGLIANLYVILFVAVFIAADPPLYRDGMVNLFPVPARERVRQVVNASGDALWHWMVGRVAAMIITGLLIAISLWIVGVPLAFFIGAITGLLVFVPNIGGAIGLFLAVLVALPEGTQTAVWAAGACTLVQLLESNVITPLIQQRQISAPPALLISWQVVFFALFGLWGLLVAAPILAVVIVLHREAWRPCVLGITSDRD